MVSQQGSSTPEWHVWVAQSPRESLELVAHEGVNRLVFSPTADSRERISKEMIQTFGFLLGDRMESFLFDLAVEACDVGVKLGLALGTLDGHLDPRVDDFEAWLQQAIAAAGLGGYKTPIKLELPN